MSLCWPFVWSFLSLTEKLVLALNLQVIVGLKTQRAAEKEGHRSRAFWILTPLLLYER